MSKDLNVCSFTGNLTRDPEVKNLPSGSTVTNFSIAVNSSFKDKNGDWKENTTFVDFDVWNGLGEAVTKVLNKGDKAWVQAEYSLRTWDSNEGEKRSRPQFRVLAWGLLNKAAANKAAKVESNAEGGVNTSELAAKADEPKRRGRPKTKPVVEEDDESIPPF
jgi:single-strand DNA-binding protein